jgi:hypothetical protein
MGGSNVSETETERRGLSRRDMIKGAAAAGVAAWTAPVILDSLMSPAAAASGPVLTSSLSYALIVFDYGGSRYVMKITGGQATCAGGSAFSGDVPDQALTACNNTTYAISGGNLVRTAGTTFTAWAGPPTCDSLFSASGFTVTAKGGASIVYGVAHAGSYKQPPCAFDKLSVKCPTPSANNSVDFTTC